MNENQQLALIHDEFPLEEGLCYLNHAAVAPWPKRTADAVTKFAAENSQVGAENYPTWLRVEKQLRDNLTEIIGAASPDEIALAKSTSEALSFVAYGLDWQGGDEVILCDQEFPSNRIVWESLQEKFGVHIVVVAVNNKQSPEQAIFNAISAKTRLVTVSSVQYGTGLRLNTTLLGNELKRRKILFCVDAIQSLGVCPIDVQRDNIDFLMADGHKWLLGPEGLAVFYVKRNRQDMLKLNEYGWHMVKHRGDYSKKNWEIANDATRFECGSPNMLAIHALNASLQLILEIGIPTIEKLVRSHLHFLRKKLSGLPNLTFITEADDERIAGILTIRINGLDAELIQKSLVRQRVICAYRGGGIRFSPHFYTSRSDLEKAAGTLKSCIFSLLKDAQS